MFFCINEIVNKELRDIESLYNKIQSSYKTKPNKTNTAGKASVSINHESLYERSTTEGMVLYKHLIRNGKQYSVKLGGLDNSEVIRIKQKRYNMMMLKVLEKNLKLLKKIEGRFILYDPESIDELLKPVYRDYTGLVNKTPGITSSDEWKQINTRNRYKLPDDCNTTTDGVKTRSKSEVIVYGILKGYGLVIKFDVEITLKNEYGQNVIVSPDFIILCDDGSMIIIEHLGMLDNADYLEKALKKIHLYQINGYRLNENLFITADYSQGRINAQAIDELVRKMILPRARKNQSKHM